MKIICLGDSLTEGVGVDTRSTWPFILTQNTSSEYEVINKGIRSDTTGGMIGRLHEDVLSEKPNCVILCGGLNDCWFDVPVNLIVANIYAVIKRLEFNGIKTIVGIPPIVFDKNRLGDDFTFKPLGGWKKLYESVDSLRDTLVSICEEYEFSYVDFQDMFDNHDGDIEDLIGEDMIHPNEEGNRYICDIVYEELMEVYKYNKERVF